MSVPWSRILDAALDVTGLALGRLPRSSAGGGGRGEEQLEAGGRAAGHLEARLAGVVVAALKEAFDRDSKRLDIEREQMDSERQRAERALRLELIRQAGDREVGRLRLVAGTAVVTWLGTLFFASRLIGGPMAARVTLGCGWMLLLASLAAAFAAQSQIGDALRRMDDHGQQADAVSSGTAGVLAPWLMVIGLALVGLAVLIA
jgi:hypothetical protein